ncbi:hypothetical protein [Methylobacterium sp. J-090]|uniref:hypothetical protein n=1 Tax=Methylobacterium sp. J-090 TaxID=2836666 RepID=UPI001FB893FD|nr:hypothetical protein [Methylobacterium sp. J-090]MCJ2083215.1 hypothetical protein [Methylobacterium sp. J-090]
MSDNRMEALERAVGHLAEQLIALARVTTAQAVVCRAVVDMVGRPGASVEDVRDHAVEMGDIMDAEIGAAVRTILADAPAGAGTLQ